MIGYDAGDVTLTIELAVGQEILSTDTVRLQVLAIELTVLDPWRTLMQQNDFELVVSPAGLVSTGSYYMELRRANTTTWYQLSTSQQLTGYVHRVAGTFFVRGRVSNNGVMLDSPEVEVYVQFPTYDDIVAHAAVISATDAAWANTRAATSPNVPATLREEGFWIRLNTTNGTYEFTATVTGDVVDAEDELASIDIDPEEIGNRPSDSDQSPSPVSAGVTYTVACFHTHCPTFHWVDYQRDAGPSGQNGDDGWHALQNVAGIVYDYTADPVPPGHPINSAGQRYPSPNGPTSRRTTP